jgi:two-component system response regulator (stage 0 sporulation protein A)
MKKGRELEIKKEINKILLNMGVATNTKGFKYLLDSIYIVYNDNEFLSQMIKGVYYKIVDKYNDTYNGVERAMRYSVEKVFLNGNLELIDEIFGYSISQYKHKPSNSQFISAIVNYLDFNI